jgi:2-dehydro-3-deoxyphosphogluconate aldolase / (4S)-4-hydroxy-2-oxoglutarate aldolase
MKKQDVRAQIERIGIVPVIRASSGEEAHFAAQAVWQGGIPIVEITMTVPGALEVISQLVRTMPEVLVGAGTVLDKTMARKCKDAGAQFLVTPGFDKPTVVEARKLGLLIMAGALTPSEVMAAWNSGADFVKVFPCGSVGGPAYLKALRGPLPQVPLVPTGSVSLETVTDYIRAGAAAVGVGGELVLKNALREGRTELISALARKFVERVKDARRGFAEHGQ